MELPYLSVVEKERPATLRELSIAYRKSSWFQDLADVTKVNYIRNIEVLIDSPYKDKSPDSITPAMADTIYRYIKTQHGVRTAQYVVAVWCRVYTYGMKYLGLLVNPWSLVSCERPAPRKQCWTEDQVFAVIEKALELGEKSIAIGVCLMYDTAQRPGDVLKLTANQLKKDDSGWFLELKQAKRGAEVKPALSEYTVNLIAPGHSMSSSAYIVDGFGGRLSEFRTKFNDIKDICGIPKELQLRDLRRSALTEMGAASDDQMVAVSGHRDRNMLGIYSLKSRTKALEAQKIRHATRNSRLSRVPGGI